jgi:phosphoglycolate phosphatase-like HAD superfamily hydrolase
VFSLDAIIDNDSALTNSLQKAFAPELEKAGLNSDNDYDSLFHDTVAIRKEGYDFKSLIHKYMSIIKAEVKDTNTVTDKVTTFTDAYNANIGNISLQENVFDTFKTLLEMDYRVALVSNHPQQLVDCILSSNEDSNNLKDLVSIAVGHSKQCPLYKPDAGMIIYTVEMAGGDIGKAIYFATSVLDVKAARAAGLPCIAITECEETQKAVSRFHPEMIIDTIEDIPNALEQLMDKSMY